VWSFRRLKSNYYGYAIQLSDGTNHTDIHFVENEIDAESAQTAIDSGQTKIRKFYDQSGNGLDLVQTDFSKMFTIELDATPAYRPVARSTSGTTYMDTESDTILNDIFSNNGYMALGLRYNSGNELGRLFINYTGVDAEFTFPLTVGANEFMALEILHDSSNLNNIPTVKINTVGQTVTQVTKPNGIQVIDTTKPFRVGTGVDGTSGLFGDFWEIIIIKDVI
jgi:hypothetical protein